MCISAGNRQHEGFWVVLYRSAARDFGSDETKHARIRQILFAMSVSAPKRRLRSESLGLQNLKQKFSQRSVVGVCSLIDRSSGALSYSFSANLAKLKTIFWESGFFGASASTIGVLIRIAQSGLSLGQTKMAMHHSGTHVGAAAPVFAWVAQSSKDLHQEIEREHREETQA